eukprot:gnl/Dysnectes_brevis/268_a299_4714.p1 GENE.gnl/Dysnectes_brevis/268_a299_4714~~gnl/Dysnectes_brevis/268_a299_4714.p1  ORF type:complete len:485 (+),score=199.17 gnl/Dysnectes_brevis/268_a299_4714:47-1501(+)
MDSPKPYLSETDLNPQILAAKYAVRGAVPLKAIQINHDLKTKTGKKYPFSEVIFCNIGNPHALGQKPMTFPRQLLALVQCPSLLESPPAIFSKHAIERATAILAAVPAGMGAYTHSKGISLIRDEVAAFIEERDGFPSDPESIFLTDGASPGVKLALQISSGPVPAQSGILIPIPQYPLYSASIALLGCHALPYYLEEAKGWAVDMHALRNSIEEARTNGITPRSLCIINPGNPVGAVMSPAEQRAVLELCVEEGLIVIADEVYQENVYAEGASFTSFKKVLRQWEQDTGKAGPPLFSFHSVSKGFLGECGMRGGYFEAVNIPESVMAQIYKLQSVSLCSNTAGQVTVSSMVHPPPADCPAGRVYLAERAERLDSLRRRAVIASRRLNAIPHMSSAPVAGALYAFPTVELPASFIANAEALERPADELYCLGLLEATGVCVVPGSGFRQREGTFHFRMTILPPESKFDAFLDKMERFHASVWAK